MMKSCRGLAARTWGRWGAVQGPAGMFIRRGSSQSLWAISIPVGPETGSGGEGVGEAGFDLSDWEWHLKSLCVRRSGGWGGREGRRPKGGGRGAGEAGFTCLCWSNTKLRSLGGGGVSESASVFTREIDEHTFCLHPFVFTSTPHPKEGSLSLELMIRFIQSRTNDMPGMF